MTVSAVRLVRVRPAKLAHKVESSIDFLMAPPTQEPEVATRVVLGVSVAVVAIDSLRFAAPFAKVG